MIFSALLGTVGAFGIWWGGAAAPGRPIASGLPLLMLPIAAAFRAAPMGSRTPRGAAPAALDQHRHRHHADDFAGRPADQQRARRHVGAARILVAAMGIVDARADLHQPSVAHRRAAHASGGWRSRLRRRSCWRGSAPRARASSALVAAGTLAAALIAIAMTMPLLAGRSAAARVDLSARSRLTALDGFDARVRPASMVYDPLRRGAAIEVVPQLTLGVRPLQRTDRQPVRVIHNGRFSLPAGTYRIDVHFNDRAAEQAWPLALQVGRVGPPLQSWTIQAQPGQVWTTTLVAAGQRELRRAARPGRNGDAPSTRSPSRPPPSSMPGRGRLCRRGLRGAPTAT